MEQAPELTEAIHYSKAPIIEALIDIQIGGLPGDALEALKAIHLSGYALPQRMGLFTGEFKISESKPVASATDNHIGFRFESGDKKYVLQARLNGFTISRLAPYESWEPFVSEAKTAWAAYREAVGNVAITQVSVRYINKIHMPPASEMKLYLRTTPEISPDLPQMLSGIFMRLEIPYTQPPALLVHQQFYAPPDEPGQIGLFLDNEVRAGCSLESISDSDLWDRIEELRDVKNQAFRGCLTKKMEEILA
ncbi:MAG TPA: TIGR04255 family protein [Bryobacteraceae bacterium]|nr:TIGR04255 family protein [Bryobacteraceae bacterium]